MIARLVAWSLDNRLIVSLCVLVLAVAGVRAYRTLPMDAVPDVSNVQVQVLTNAPGLSPLEVESMVTRPIELAMSGLPGVVTTRSVSRSGVSAVTLVFDDESDLVGARALVSQRLPAASSAIPPTAARPELGPLSTSLGEVYHFTLRWPGHELRELRAWLDWQIAPDLRSVPGVVEVNPWGGDERQIEVRLREHDLRAFGVSQEAVERALLAGGQNAGGGSLVRGDEQIFVRIDGQYRSLSDVASQVVGTRGGVAILVRDVATVSDGHGQRASAASADGGGETVYAMVQMVAGGNAHVVVSRVKSRLQELRKRLPAGLVIEPFYDRAALVDHVLDTVRSSLLEGGLIVIAVLFALLGDVFAGMAVAITIPLAMLGAFTLMKQLGMSGNLMSLGAIDFGLVVDGAVVIVEGGLAAMVGKHLSARAALAEASQSVGRPIAFGVMIIALVYVPVLLLEGVEGKMFRPMAWTVLFALGTALVLTFSFVPVLASLLLRRTEQHEPRLVSFLRRVYGALLVRIVGRPRLAAAIALMLVAVGALGLASRGAEFVPRLEEGDLVVQVTRPASVSVQEAVQGTTTVEQVLRRFPEVTRVVSRSGSPGVATDVMGIEQSDVFVMLRPAREWVTAHDREALVAVFARELTRALPGTGFGFTQPIEMRVQELLGGMKSDVGVKLFGDDLPTLTRLAGQAARALSEIQGAADVRVEPTSGLPLLTLRPSPEKMGRLGISALELRAAVEALRTGRVVGTFVEGNARYPVALRWDRVPSADPSSVAMTPLSLNDGRVLKLGDACEVSFEEGPAQVSREQARRRVLIEANVRGRDLASFVRDLERALGSLELPSGYYFTVSGQYENLVHAATRFALIVPATLAAIFVLLYLAFGSSRPALLILINVPVAASGGVLALAARDLPLSISAGVGFIALFGVATLNGVVLISAVRNRERAGASPHAAVLDAAQERLRPVVTTAVVASLGFLPMALARGTGAEVQRPLATVVMGGLVTATVLTLALLPALYAGRRGPSSAT
jgi:cobalt-zinc-cadmium resistance protein CzcA